MKRSRNLSVVAAGLLAASGAHATTPLNLLSAFTTATGSRVGSAEILAYTKDDHGTVLSTVGDNAGGSFGVQILSLNSNGTLSEKGFADFSSTFGAASNWNGASSVDVDPLQRGFGAVSLIQSNSTDNVGKVGFFDYRGSTANASRNLTILDVGYHPDSVKFSADGTKLFVVNEGELNPSLGRNAPGSISIIDLSSVNSINGVASLTNANVSTFDFSAANLGTGVSLAGLRNPSVLANSGTFNANVPDFNALSLSDPNFYKGMEPEYLTQVGNKLFVTMQENNAIGVFDFTSNKWETIHKLGTITQTIDASDQDGGAFVNDVVRGLPLPDAIASYSSGGRTYLVTANEGDARTDDRDISRFGDTSGNDSMNPLLAPSLVNDPSRANNQLGRLNVSRIDGDTNGDGKIDTPTMIGTRSFTIWDSITGLPVWDSGSLESLLLNLDPSTHNMNNGLLANRDTRSDDKGPEVEALTVGQINGRTYAFVGLERQNGLLMFDITNPTSAFFSGYTNSYAAGLVSPESLIFISGLDNPTGKDLVLAGYEVSNGIGVYQTPDASATIGLILAGFVGLIGLRRRS
jgi:hypothetical protein